jgi:hypothetical protein
VLVILYILDLKDFLYGLKSRATGGSTTEEACLAI